MRRPIFSANWKMFKTARQTREFFRSFAPEVEGFDDREVIIAPPFTSLAAAVEATSDYTIDIAAQNMYFAPEGAFTGEISAEMIKETGATSVILGHSERRHVFGESDTDINKKLHVAVDSGLRPIFCVGELIEDREAGKTNDILRQQISAGLQGFDSSNVLNMVIAYEPVWAIGTGKTATPEIAQETHLFIRELLTEIFNSEISQGIRILYGGSVKPGNIKELMAKDDIDGVLVGGASLEPESFASIVKC